MSLLLAEVNNVIFPGECVTLPIPVNFLADSDLAVEPREENVSWFHPCIVKNATGSLSLVNDMDNPIKVKKAQIIGQVRSVVLPSDKPSTDSIFIVSPDRTQNYNSNVHIITVDPGNILNREEKLASQNVNAQYNSVLNPQFGTYNEKSGKVVASVHTGKTTPTPKKGKVPSSKKSSLLQDKFDDLVNLGVLIRPEDNNINVIHTSPSFLVKKPNNSYRLVTSFVELNKFIYPLLSKLCTTNDVLTALGSWKYIIKTDLKSSYFQIQMDQASQKWMRTNTPYKGMYVYNRAPMGLRNMAEYLEEVIARILGDCLAEGILAKISDDLIIGGNSISELLSNWTIVLRQLRDNNLSLSDDKTFVCPTSINVIGCVWSNGNPLTTSPPNTVKQLRFFIGAFRAISRCIPGYGKYLCFLEDTVAGRESREDISWDSMLEERFQAAQKALCNPRVITLPHPNDQLILVSDGSNSPPAVGST